ncbi:MerR family transcriptional regulator [Novosphingobium colocasiae]|uniref:HTH merR-type domain-containing protein n=1 Tax=Novosphingobium colocasiae TaxID=1256513 RepID=A0A918PB27_9SPHN|nr:MerR family transcriptional regulator [Novosphingobium colocasiae]GGY96019.1 hypothetical protein GCM10011614_08460 [Novosphingobium colocasiae]
MDDDLSRLGYDDGKDPGAMRTIGEVAKALGIRQHVLRYWEDQFPSLRPVKRSGGRRYYRPDDVAMIARIDRLVHKEGYTLRGARLALQGASGEAASVPAEPLPMPAIQPVAPRAGAEWPDQLARIRDGLAKALAEA